MVIATALLFVLLLVPSAAFCERSTDLRVRAYRTEAGSSPPAGGEIAVSVGEVIAEAHDYKMPVVARIADLLEIKVFLGRGAVPPSVDLLAYDTSEWRLYCTDERVFFVTGEGRYVLCLRDENDDGAFESWTVPGAPMAFSKWRDLEGGPVPFEETKSKQVEGQVRELVYMGGTETSISLVYREYLDDLRSPSLQQQLTYTLSTEGPTQINFQGLALEVHSTADNTLRGLLRSGFEN